MSRGTRSPAGSHRAGLEVLRGTAALLVVIIHSFPSNGAMDPAERALRSTALGQSSVCVFFALSGYLVGAPWIHALQTGGPLPHAGGYALRRFLRIWPSYALALFVGIALGLHESQVTHAWQVPVHLLLLQSVVPGQYSALLPVAWTLGVEAGFYLLLPVAARLVRRRVGARPLNDATLLAGLAGIWVAGALFMAAGDLARPGINDTTGLTGPLRYDIQTLMGVFAAGLAVAVLEHRRAGARCNAQVSYVAAGLIAVPALLVGSLAYATPAISEFRFSLLGISAALVIWGALLPGPLDDHRLAPLAAAGRWSYGMYLGHSLLLFWLRDRGRDVGGLLTSDPLGPHPAPVVLGVWALDAAVFLAVGLALGALSWRFIERPCLTWAGRRARQWSQPRPEPAATVAPAAPAVRQEQLA